MRRSWTALVVVFFPVLLAAADGTVTGKLTLNGKSYELKHVYAWKAADPFEKKKMNTCVLLSDIAVDADALNDMFARRELAEKGKLNGLMVQFDAEGSIVSGDIYCEQLKETFGTFTATGMHEWDKKTLTDSAIEGTLYTKKLSHFLETMWEYTATFSAPVKAAEK